MNNRLEATSGARHAAQPVTVVQSGIVRPILRCAWYLVQCKPHEDRRAVDNLRNQGFGTFAPTCLVERRSRAGARTRLEPLFPGYVFVEFDRTGHNWGALRSTRGVARLVRFGAEPAAVPDHVVEYLRRLDGIEVNRGAPAPVQGDRVRIVEGPFAGLSAVFVEQDGVARVQVLIELMHRQVAVRLDTAAVVVA